MNLFANKPMCDIWKYIISIRGTIYQRTQEPFIRMITVYTKDGIVTHVGVTAKPERMKKARCVGLCVERKIIPIENGPQIANPEGFDIQKGSYELLYYLDKKSLSIFKLD